MNAMYRQIFTSERNIINIPIPNEWEGMDIEVIAFPVTFGEIRQEVSMEDKRRKRNNLLDKYLIDLSDYKFNREEANNYD